ncbi:hypothetical protein [Chitinophaga sp.]|uniref:hypothetical protein n=1 Tax=Chitinophaga sp. TaxID=1869181 RepID=UPI0031D2E24E
MNEETNKPLNIIDNLKLNPPAEEEKLQHMKGKDCPACGAHSAKQAGLTHCAYCGYEFENSGNNT